MKLIKGIALVSAAGLLAACGSDDDGEAPINYPPTYQFESKVTAGESSVKFTGQAARQLLIGEIKEAVGNSSISQADLETIYSDGTTVLDNADIYGGERADTPIYISAPDGFTLAQDNYTAIVAGAGSKNLADKMAGCDNDLSASEFIGWEVTATVDCNGDELTNEQDKPHNLVLEWLEAAATSEVDAALGLDYNQLLQKFLLGAVAFSQTAEDYLSVNHAKDGKGLKADNTAGDSAYTDLEHAWDEGFGYFGASLDYLSIDDATVSTDKVYHSDVNGDTVIDLLNGEYVFGLAQYANKHDVMTGTTDLSNEIMVAFLEGRQLIVDNHGTTPEVGDALHTRLAGISDRAVKGLEKVIAISVIKYINKTIDDLAAYTHGVDDGSDIAKHWSELKGFALGLQFNPSPVLTERQQIELHAYIGQSPITEIGTTHSGLKADYILALEAARSLIQTAFDFDENAVANWK